MVRSGAVPSVWRLASRPRIFDVPWAIFSTSSYCEDAGTVCSELEISKHIAMSSGAFPRRVLVVDDLVDSGVTLDKVLHYLK